MTLEVFSDMNDSMILLILLIAMASSNLIFFNPCLKILTFCIFFFFDSVSVTAVCMSKKKTLVYALEGKDGI